jgi:biotin carboxyl carrier protein
VEYKLEIQDSALPAEVETGEDGTLEIRFGEEVCAVEYKTVSPHQIHLVLRDHRGERSLNAFVADGPEGKTIVIDGIPYRVRDAGAPKKKSGRRGGLGNAPREVTPPMPSVVTKVLVAEGDLVKKGQGVVVVSAMKMETTLTAPYDGVVTGIDVAVDDKVAPGQVLVRIDEKKEEPA